MLNSCKNITDCFFNAFFPNRLYLHALEEEENLQLALAVSASLQNCADSRQPEELPTNNQCGDKRKKRIHVKRKPRSITPPPLLLTSSPEAKRRLMMKVQEMLSQSSDDELPCTPAIPPSTLGVPAASNQRGVAPEDDTGAGRNVRKSQREDGDSLRNGDVHASTKSNRGQMSVDGPANRSLIGCPGGVSPPVMSYKTMWQLSAYAEDEPTNEFYVETLNGRLSPQVHL